MKKTLLILSAMGCLVLPAVSHADATTAKGKNSSKTAAAPATMAKPAPKRDHLIFYITTEAHTGSLIPMVYRSYGGRIDCASNPAVYGSTVLSKTGALDVSTTLIKLDPSITASHRR